MAAKHPEVAKLAYTVGEYCSSIGICRASLYNLWKRGQGPRRMKVGSRTLISVEAAAEYRRQCEEVANATQ
jgi:predicted DNA-binding transcriptional regulator AlpA